MSFKISQKHEPNRSEIPKSHQRANSDGTLDYVF